MVPISKGSTITLWGLVTQDAKSITFDSGKTKTTFSMRYDQTRDDDGNKISKYMEIESWGNLARYASGIERGDVVFVCGVWMKDEYLTKKKGEDRFKVVADIILVQPFAPAVDSYDEQNGISEVSDADESDPFAKQLEEAEGELPY